MIGVYTLVKTSAHNIMKQKYFCLSLNKYTMPTSVGMYWLTSILLVYQQGFCSMELLTVKADPLHAMKMLEGTEGIAPTQSWPRH